MLQCKKTASVLLSFLHPADRLAQESENVEELTRLAYLVLQGLDITQTNPTKLLTKVASLCYQVCNISNRFVLFVSSFINTNT